MDESEFRDALRAATPPSAHVGGWADASRRRAYRRRAAVGALAVVVVALQLAAIYVPFLQSFLNTTPLSMQELGLTIAAGGLVFVAAEVEKVWARRR